MIDPNKFYTENDSPSSVQNRRMWQTIALSIKPQRTQVFMIADVRSFCYGIAATVILYFAGIGAYHFVSQTIDNARPTTVKVDDAYQSAITALEKVMPVVQTAASQDNLREKLHSRVDQLRMIDEAILAARKEEAASGFTIAHRSTVRDLYSMKLKILQQMIEQGEIEP